MSHSTVPLAFIVCVACVRAFFSSVIVVVLAIVDPSSLPNILR